MHVLSLTQCKFSSAKQWNCDLLVQAALSQSMCVNNIFIIYVYDEGFILCEWLDWKRNVADYRIWVADGSSQSYCEWAALRNQPRFPDLCVHKFKHQKLEIFVKNMDLDRAMIFFVLSVNGKNTLHILKKKAHVYKVTETSKSLLIVTVWTLKVKIGCIFCQWWPVLRHKNWK